MYRLIRPLLFALTPEQSHALTIAGLRALGAMTPALPPPALPRRVMGLDFPNPVGLAAGLDKNAEALDGFGQLGFGFIEVGTVTPVAQPGNPAPRLFRLPEAEALINRMGFNNHGLGELCARLEKRRYRGVVGVNIGKNRDTPVEQALEDYLIGLRRVYALADYVAVNISSPNTPGLRTLQEGAALDGLLAALKEEQARQADTHGRYVPLAVKVAPDLDERQIREMAEALLRHRIDGLIATNTTLSRAGVEGLRHAEEQGGLSGRPLFPLSTTVLEQFRAILGEEIPIIAVGGIGSGEDALAKLRAGASLVQVYTGLIYRGPMLARQILRELRRAT
ncbi:MAG: quinone-dependent dihydroorotate dehydrogenase [Gammaproteobacteria bacterium]|jgi:dihydroorotate dehydrogenase